MGVFVLAPVWWRVGSAGTGERVKPWGQGQVMGVLQSESASATGSNEKSCSTEGGVQMNCSPGKLRALAVVFECQNRPSGETSHSNWWLCIRQMHFYRVIHLSPSFLPLFLAAMFPHCHHSLSPYHLPLTPFSFIFPLYTSTSSFYPSSLPLMRLTSVRLKIPSGWKRRGHCSLLLTPARLHHKCTPLKVKDHAFVSLLVSLVLCAPASPPPAHKRKTIWKTRSWQWKWLHRPCIYHTAVFLLRIIRIRLISTGDICYIYICVCVCVCEMVG